MLPHGGQRHGRDTAHSHTVTLLAGLACHCRVVTVNIAYKRVEQASACHGPLAGRNRSTRKYRVKLSMFTSLLPVFLSDRPSDTMTRRAVRLRQEERRIWPG